MNCYSVWKMVAAQRLWMPLLSFLQDTNQLTVICRCITTLRLDTKQLRIMYRFIPTISCDVIKQSNWSPVRQLSVKHCTISSPVGNQTEEPHHKLNQSVPTEHGFKISNGDNDRTRRKTNNNFIVYVEKENEYFHSYLSNSVQYKPLFLPGCSSEGGPTSRTHLSAELDPMLSLGWSSDGEITQDKLLSTLKNVSRLPVNQHMKIFHDSNFHEFCKQFLHHLPDLSDEAYVESMAALSKLNFRQCITPDLRDLRVMIARSFDEENIKRMSDWPTRQLLLVADLYFHLRCSSSQRLGYLRTMLSTVLAGDGVSELGQEEMVTVLLHVGLTRQLGERELNEALLRVCQHIDSYTIDELGIVSLAFFKTNKPVRNTLFQHKLATKLKSCVTDVHPICLSAVLKCLQKSSNKLRIRYQPELLQLMVDLQPSLSVRMLSLTPQTALHVLSIFHSFKYISQQLVSAFSAKLAHDHLKDWRLKDMALAVRLLAELSESFPNKTEILTRLTSELSSSHRESEVESHLDYLVRFLLGLAMAGVYCEPLLVRLFKPESLDYFTGHKVNLYRDLYQLSESVRIECPEYRGPLLPDHLVTAQSKKSYICGRLPRVVDKSSDDDLLTGSKRDDLLTRSKRDDLMQQCVRTLNWVLAGQRHQRVDFLLPHYQTADIELCSLSSEEKTKRGCRVAVLVYAENAYYSLIQADGSVENVLRGNYAMKRRQLKLLGFTIIEIPFYEFNPLAAQEKCEYVLSKLQLAGVVSEDHVLPTQ